jgi:hypothetical protein
MEREKNLHLHDMKKIKKIELSFACDEDWNKMMPVEQGRHCSSCQKSVVDFSTFTDKQIISFYANSKNTTTCGRFRIGQLENLNDSLHPPIHKKQYNFLRPIVASALLTAACSSERVQGEIKMEPNTNRTEQPKDSTIHRTLGEVGIVHENYPTTNSGKSESTEIRIKKDTSFKEKNLPETRVVRNYPSVTEINEVYHTAGVPIMTYDDEIQIQVMFGQTLKKVRWYNRLGYRIKNIFKRKK